MTAKPPIQSRFIFLLYFVVRTLGFPILLVYFLYRGYRDPRYFRHFAERAGALPAAFKRTAPGSIWLHAVSVGEVVSAVQLIVELRKTNPQIPLYVSVATMAGRTVAHQKLAQSVDGIFFAPIDYKFAVRSVVRSIRPAVLVVLETEIWPVLYRELKRDQCGLIVLNGRISDRAFPSYLRLRRAFAPVLSLPDEILTQSETDQRRYLELGAPPSKVRTFGNLKYDATPPSAEPPELITELMQRLRPSAVWIAASTMPGLDTNDVDEDDAVVNAFRELAPLHPGLLLIVAPRRPERFNLVSAKLRSAGLESMRRSSGENSGALALPCVVVLDTIGELTTLFPVADVVFLGGTLARRGGHNVLEPAACGKPIVVGPHMENFSAIAADFRAHGAWFQIAGRGGLAGAVDQLLRDPEQRRVLGTRAMELAAKNRGVAERAAALIVKAHDVAIPVWKRRNHLGLLSRLWELGSGLKQKRDLAHAVSLGRPVISVGGIAMGGTGKTPFVEMLARKLRERGLKSAILTRGYRRRSFEKTIIAAAGTQLLASHTGDEAQIFLRSGVAHLGIGADRYVSGRALEARLHPDIFLLDDGFQHRRLKRNLDIVLIDALNPFPGGAVFPVGFMREPVSALARADLFVITRAQPGRQYTGVRAVLERTNPRAKVFVARVVPGKWIPCEPPVGSVAAFCGLGNPATFWQTLRDQGFDPVFTWTFGDHQTYRPKELLRLAYQARSRGIRALLTTEKDAMNLPADAAELVAPAKIHWLKIATEVDNEEELMRLILKA